MPNENEITNTLHKMETCRGRQTEGARKNTKYRNRAEILKKEKRTKPVSDKHILTVNLL